MERLRARPPIMSQLTPTPTPTPAPTPRPDEVTQPNAVAGATPDDARRVLARSPAQWEAEALAVVEEADARTGIAAGVLRYAAARMFEDGVGDLAAAMDHLQLALDDPPAATFRPVLRALRLHAVLAGSFWTAIDLLEVETAAAGSVAARADLAVEKADLLEHQLLARDRARAALEEALGLVPGHPAALLALELGASSGTDPADALFLQRALERRLTAATSSADRGRLLCRLALLAEADPSRDNEALGLWLRALDEEAGRGDGRAGPRRDAPGGRAPRQGRGARARRGARGGGVERRGAGSVAGARRGARAPPVGIGRPRRQAARRGLGRGAGRSGAAVRRRVVRARGGPVGESAPRASIATPSAPGIAIGPRRCRAWPRTWPSSTKGTTRSPRRGSGVCSRHGRGIPVALAGLERIASRTGDAAGQVTLAEGAVDRSDDAAERAALAMRAAELAETAAHDLPRAAALARRALDAVPGYLPAVHLLERLYPALGRWDELVEVVEATRRPARPPQTGRPATTACARGGTRSSVSGALYEDPLGDPGKALALYGEWAALGSGVPPHCASLLRAAEKAGDALVAAEAALKLGTEIRELSAEARFAWCFRAATIYEERAAADDEAIRAYEAALALAPGSRPALAGLARAYYRRGQFEALATCSPEQAASEPNPANASALEPSSRPAWLRVSSGPARRRAGGGGARPVVRSGERRRHGRARAPAGAHDARGATRWQAALGSLGAGPVRFRRQGGRLPAAGGNPRVAAGGQARQALAAIERAAAALGGRGVPARWPRSGARAPVPARGAGRRAGRRRARAADRHTRDGGQRRRRAASREARVRRSRRASAGGRRRPRCERRRAGRRLDLAWRLGDQDRPPGARCGRGGCSPPTTGRCSTHAALATKLGRDLDRAQALEKLAASSTDAAIRRGPLRAAATARARVSSDAERDAVRDPRALPPGGRGAPHRGGARRSSNDRPPGRAIGRSHPGPAPAGERRPRTVHARGAALGGRNAHLAAGDLRRR